MSFRETLTQPPKVQAVTADAEQKYFVKVMTGAERHSMETACFGKDTKGPDFAAHLLARTLCDAGGVREFTDAETDLVAQGDSTLISALFDAAYALNKLGKKGQDDAKNA